MSQAQHPIPPEGFKPYEWHLEHLVGLASQAGWKKYAWQRAQEMAKHPSKLWPDMDTALTDAMKTKTNSSAQFVRPLESKK